MVELLAIRSGQSESVKIGQVIDVYGCPQIVAGAAGIGNSLSGAILYRTTYGLPKAFDGKHSGDNQ